MVLRTQKLEVIKARSFGVVANFRNTEVLFLIDEFLHSHVLKRMVGRAHPTFSFAEG
jgi:hypothetical protein